MNLEPAPRLNKLAFFAIDAGLLVTAIIIVYFAKNPYAPLPFVTAVACVLIAAIIGLAPLVMEFVAENRDYVQEERRRVTDQVQRLQAAVESLGRAASQIKAIEEAVHKTAHAAENLPYRMQEKLAEFNQQLAQTDDEEKERLNEELDSLRESESERLKAIVDKIHKSTADWSALEAATRKQLGAAEAALTKAQGATLEAATKLEARVATALAALDTKLAQAAEITAPPLKFVAPAPAPAPAPTPAPAAPVEAASEPKPEPATASLPLVESVSVTEASAPLPAEPAALVAEEPKPKKPRAPRKPKVEEPVAPAAGIAGTSDGEPAFNDTPAEPAPAPVSSDEASSASPAESSASSDGATRLLATAYIGIGNKLYIRGDGPGLSWDKGVPMQFVSIGKWGWASHDATAPVTCKLYKNDDTAALTGEVVLEPGRHVEITALF